MITYFVYLLIIVIHAVVMACVNIHVNQLAHWIMLGCVIGAYLCGFCAGGHTS